MLYTVRRDDFNSPGNALFFVSTFSFDAKPVDFVSLPMAHGELRRLQSSRTTMREMLDTKEENAMDFLKIFSKPMDIGRFSR
jgi:UTP:GlnB (protein PII) uridylyltransferase